MYVCAHMYSCSGQKRASDPLGLELQSVASQLTRVLGAKVHVQQKSREHR